MHRGFQSLGELSTCGKGVPMAVFSMVMCSTAPFKAPMQDLQRNFASKSCTHVLLCTYCVGSMTLSVASAENNCILGS